MNTTQQELIAQLKIGHIYRHYKNKLYKVHMLSKSSDDLSWWVVYEALYENGLSKIWHRRLEDFLQVGVWVEGQLAMPRFALVKENENEK